VRVMFGITRSVFCVTRDMFGITRSVFCVTRDMFGITRCVFLLCALMRLVILFFLCFCIAVIG
jgi:hypothetical protein